MLQGLHRIQQCFSAEKHPTLWWALPAIEELQTSWEVKHDNARFSTYSTVIDDSLTKLNKYYSWFNEKLAYVLALSKCPFVVIRASGSQSGCSLHHITVLHPYFKLMYIRLVWGGPEEQEAECHAGNPYAKDRQDEAQKILEHVVCVHPFCTHDIYFGLVNGALLQEPANYSEPKLDSTHYGYQ